MEAKHQTSTGKIITRGLRAPYRFGMTALWLVAGLVAASGSVRADKELFTPDHVAKLRDVASAVISPDGRHIAYTLSVPRVPWEDESGGPWSELHVTDLEGNSRPFITGKVNVGRVSWVPDGSGVAFLAKRGDDKQNALYIIPLDGGEARKAFSHETDIMEYTWSPDGRRIAFVARDKMPKEREKLKDKGFNAEIYEEDYLAERVWVGEIDKPDAKPRAMELPGTPSDLEWSPVGTQLAMSLAPTSLIDDALMEKKLHVFDVDSGSIVSSFKNSGKLGRSSWSPDGKKLAVIAAEDIHDPAEGRLVIADPDDGSLTDILPNYEAHVGAIGWQDKDTVMFLGEEGVWTTFNKIGRNGTNRNIIIPKEKIVLTSMSLSKDGQTSCFISNSPTHTSEVYVMRHGDSMARRLTDSNPWLADMRFAPQEVVTYSARDGLQIEGLLFRPLDEQRGKRYPLILVVHGGPEAHYSQGWLTRYSMAGQMGAARGFAVFMPNYRGSTGRGVAFSKMGQADYAGKEFDDLVDGVDHLIATGLVDRDRVGVTGGSYGGFATAWCSTYYSERFAAGVMFVGVSNHVSKAGTTDIPNEMTLVHARKRLWEDWEFFSVRSPIYHVQKSRTPLLILHGKEDTRVHPAQSLELFRHLKTLAQAPVRLVLYPGEGHGNRKSASRLDYNLRMMRWFEHYLKGPGGPAPSYDLDYGFDKDEEE